MKLKFQFFIVFFLFFILSKNVFAVGGNSIYSFQAHLDGGKNIDVDVLWPEIDQQRAELLTHLADRSTVTADPVNQPVSGMFTSPDRIVITQSLLIWFSLSGPLGGITNGGGGFIRGLWTLYKDPGGFYNFSQIRNSNNWAPNEFLPGSDGVGAQGSGISFLGQIGVNVDDPTLVGAFAAENSGVRDFYLSMTPIRDGGWGNGIGYFYQTIGKLTHSQNNLSLLKQKGYRSINDMNPDSPGEVQVEYVLTYRILPDEPVFQYTLSLTPHNGQTAKIATFVLSHNSSGSNGFQHHYYTVDTGTAIGNGCTRNPPPIASNQEVDIKYIGPYDLYFWQNAIQGVPGTKWLLMENSGGTTGRIMLLEPLLYSPYTVPDKIDIIRNRYSSGNNTWVNAYDIQYTDINQCGGNIIWDKNQTVWLGAQITLNKLNVSIPKADADGDGKVCLSDYVWLQNSFNGVYDSDQKKKLKADFKA